MKSTGDILDVSSMKKILEKRMSAWMLQVIERYNLRFQILVYVIPSSRILR